MLICGVNLYNPIVHNMSRSGGKERAMALSEKQQKTVCRFGRGKMECRYITSGLDGVQCQKHTALRVVIDLRVALKQKKEQGDHCPGKKHRWPRI